MYAIRSYYASENQFRQHPLDYIEGLEITIKGALKQAPADVAKNIVGISVDTTGSTPVAVNKEGTPLSVITSYSIHYTKLYDRLHSGRAGGAGFCSTQPGGWLQLAGASRRSVAAFV